MKVGDGAAAGGAWILRALRGSRGRHLSSGYLMMTLVKEEVKINTAYVEHSWQFLAFVSGIRSAKT